LLKTTAKSSSQTGLFRWRWLYQRSNNFRKLEKFNWLFGFIRNSELFSVFSVRFPEKRGPRCDFRVWGT